MRRTTPRSVRLRRSGLRAALLLLAPRAQMPRAQMLLVQMLLAQMLLRPPALLAQMPQAAQAAGTAASYAQRAAYSLQAWQPVPLDETKPAADRAKMRMLSEYLPSLAGGPGDTPVFILEGKEAGATVFVCAGTHANEIAGVVGATIWAERAQLRTGRLIVLPRANRSAATWPDPDRPGPPHISITAAQESTAAQGARIFALGSRFTQPDDEGRPDPALYRHPDSTQTLEGREARNLDRAYPGSAEGGLTSRIAYAISSLIQKEGVDIALDLHEANPDSKLAWMIVANPKNIDIAALAALNLEEKNIHMGIDASAAEPRGLSHREWGDRTGAAAFLIETPNPGQWYPPYTKDPVDDAALPLRYRVAVQMAATLELIAVYNETAPISGRFVCAGLPSYEDILAQGVGAFLE